MAGSKSDFDKLVADMPTLIIEKRNPETREERDDPQRIWGVKSLGDIAEKVQERVKQNVKAGITKIV